MHYNYPHNAFLNKYKLQCYQKFSSKKCLSIQGPCGHGDLWSDLFVVGWFVETELQAGVIWWYQLRGYSVIVASDSAKWLGMFRRLVQEFSLSMCVWTSRVHEICAGFSWILMAGVDRVRAPPVTGVYIQIFGQSWTALKWDTSISLSLSLSLFSLLIITISLTFLRFKTWGKKPMGNSLRQYSVGISFPWLDFHCLIFFLSWQNGLGVFT